MTASHQYYPDMEEEDQEVFDSLIGGDDDETAADTLQQQQQQHPNWILVGCMAGLLVILCCLFFYLVLPPVMVWVRRHLNHTMTSFFDSPERVQRRYETIEGWLISKRARAHDELCIQVQNEIGVVGRAHCTCNPAKIKQLGSTDTAETELEYCGDDDDDSQNRNECPICMDSFATNDIVSWSPNGRCDHVFHHECIKEWLIHHDSCPYCRVQVLLVDGDASQYKIKNDNNNNTIDDEEEKTNKPVQSNTWTTEQLQQLAKERSCRSMATYYCIQDGLVTLQPSTTKTKKQSKQQALRRNITSLNIKSEELVQRRGSRVSCNNNTNSKDVVVMMESNGTDDEDEDDVVEIIATSENVQVLNYSDSVVETLESWGERHWGNRPQPQEEDEDDVEMACGETPSSSSSSPS